MQTKNSEGYYAIGVYKHKTDHNIGTLWRTAYILGASYIFTVGNKYKKQSSDVVRAWSRIPLFHYDTVDDLFNNIPHDCRVIGVEIDDSAIDLKEFQHPKRAIYLLGSENFGLPEEVKERCHFLIKLPGNSSLNVAVTGSIVCYERVQQQQTSFPPHHKGESL
ncbi:MAG: RNA methyltransferase [Flavobacteriia bacterium]|nr:RNA methyltransferase [Flavobacteriia bacterium]OJX35255.1 MAG: rRNA methyltransferase [Flavobacteriia bacterium 40-80]